MTINDMLEQGIVLQGYISVVGVDANANIDELYYEGCDEWYGPLDDGWANQRITYMFAHDSWDGAMLRIEVEPRERFDDEV